jgi:hypothetical protein
MKRKSFDPMEILAFISDPKNKEAEKENLFIEYTAEIIEATHKASIKGKRKARLSIEKDFGLFCENLNNAVVDLLIELYQYRIVLQDMTGNKPIIRVKATMAHNLFRCADEILTAATLTEEKTIQRPDPDFMEALKNGQV